jgi:hypothetical protein
MKDELARFPETACSRARLGSNVFPSHVFPSHVFPSRDREGAVQ